MAKLMALAVKDLRVLMADKGNVFWVLGFPLLFALLFGAIYSGAGKGPSGMKLAVVDEDQQRVFPTLRHAPGIRGGSEGHASGSGAGPGPGP